MSMNLSWIKFQHRPQVHGGGSSHSYRHGPSHMFLWYHHYPRHYIHWKTLTQLYTYTVVCLSLWVYFSIFVIEKILMYIYTHPIPTITYGTTWCWYLNLLKLMSNSQIIPAVVNSVFLVSQNIDIDGPHISNITFNWSSVTKVAIPKFSFDAATATESEQGYQLHEGCNNHIIQWTLSYNLIKLQLEGNPSVYIYLYVWYIYMYTRCKYICLYTTLTCVYIHCTYMCIF